MGANQSSSKSKISLEERKNGIYLVKVEGLPDYPILYIRLCWDPVQKQYCVPTTCDRLEKDKLQRKIIVVGFRDSEGNIHEQSFYLSSGLNAIQSLEKFFKKEFICKIGEDETGCGLWLPFSGLGYERDVKNTEDDIKLNKSYFEGSQKTFGRFASSELMLISRCLGGHFWDNNFEKFKKFDLPNLPTLFELIELIPCHLNTTTFDSNITCSIYINNYIGSASIINYSPDLKSGFYEVFKRINIPIELRVKFDFGILYYLLINPKTIFSSYSFIANLPVESHFSGNYTYLFNYYSNLKRVYDSDKEYYNKFIEPFVRKQNYQKLFFEEININNELFLEKITEKKDKMEIFDLNEKEKKEIHKEVTKKIEKSESKNRKTEENKENSKKNVGTELGTSESPFTNPDLAKKGQYYIKNGRIFLKRS